MDKWVLLPLAVFFLLYGILAVTDTHVVWGPQLMGFSALVIGVVCVIRAVAGWYRPLP